MMNDLAGEVIGGIDTHADINVAAVIDSLGRILATGSFPTSPAGHRQLHDWMASFGPVGLVGIEGTGSYGAGIARYLAAHDIAVVEVDRPDRRTRRHRGKSDPVDAEAAARAALNGEAASVPKARTGNVEAIRALRVARRSAMKARVQAIVQLRALVTTAPDELRDQFRHLRMAELIPTAARLRPGPADTVTGATKLALRELAIRVQDLNAQLERLDTALHPLLTRTCPTLLALKGCGPDSAGALLVTAGDNPDRLRSEASFARLCGVAPLEASSGRTTRHRLNRGGDRQANRALWTIVLVRMGCDPRTRAYVERRTKQGLDKKEIMRCLKRYIAREVYTCLTNKPLDL